MSSSFTSAVQQLALVGVRAFGDDPGDPVFQPGELLIVRRQRAGGDQDAAQMLGRLAGRQLIEVGNWLVPVSEVAQDRRGGAVVQPCL